MNNEIIKQAEKLYRVSLETLRSVTNLKGNINVGFVIPEYQRSYDWSKGDIERLLYDALTGLARLDKRSTEMIASDFTFLGSIILAKQEASDERFSGDNYDIVDGQQRLTTLALCACALSIRLRYFRSTLNSSIVPNSQHLKWLDDELKSMIAELDRCVIGTADTGQEKPHMFPKIIKSGEPGRGDKRGHDRSSSEYHSSIAKFFDEYASYKEQNDGKSYKDFSAPEFDDLKATMKIRDNYEIIRNVIGKLNDSSWYKDKDFKQLKITSLSKAGYEKLFHKISSFFDEDKVGEVLTDISKTKKLEPMIRTLLFSSYFHSRILLSLIDTDDVFAALDMFDSLNTTGQPLTALETLRSRVVYIERKSPGKASFAGSKSDHAYRKIEHYIDEKYKQADGKKDKKHAMTIELVISLGLYFEGERVEGNLPDQRRFLTKAYDTAAKKDLNTAQLFVTQIAQMSEFRYHYFDGVNNDASSRSQFHSPGYRDNVDLLISFISAMKTSLAIPTLFRYWTFTKGKLDRENEFFEVLQAVTAFIVLRRAATGNTAGIDNDLRGLMSKNNIPKTDINKGNCIGSAFSRKKVMPVAQLKSALRQLLEKKLGSLDKKSWIGKVIDNPIYSNSQPLAKFMILIAAHRSKPSLKNDGTWTITKVRKGPENDFFNYARWKGSDCNTVEHIAPYTENSPNVGWDKDLYLSDQVRHRLGNLTLLPKVENSSSGNQSWELKNLFYKAAASSSPGEIDKHIANAAKSKISLPDATVALLKTTHKLHIVKPLANLNVYNSNTVEVRSRNIADLTWKFLKPWLD